MYDRWEYELAIAGIPDQRSTAYYAFSNFKNIFKLKKSQVSSTVDFASVRCINNPCALVELAALST